MFSEDMFCMCYVINTELSETRNSATSAAWLHIVKIIMWKSTYHVIGCIVGYCKNYVDTEDNNKTTPLHLAAKNGFCEVYNTLVLHGADIALKDYKDRNVLELAIEKNQK